MIKNEFSVIKDKESYLFTIIGFKGQNGYGEVYITDKNSTTFTFRGYGRNNVFKKAKKHMLLIKLK
jgi:hypothetical protein